MDAGIRDEVDGRADGGGRVVLWGTSHGEQRHGNKQSKHFFSFASCLLELIADLGIQLAMMHSCKHLILSTHTC